MPLFDYCVVWCFLKFCVWVECLTLLTLVLPCLKQGFWSRADIDWEGLVNIQFYFYLELVNNQYVFLKKVVAFYSHYITIILKSEWLSTTMFQYFKPDIEMLRRIKGREHAYSPSLFCSVSVLNLLYFL